MKVHRATRRLARRFYKPPLGLQGGDGGSRTARRLVAQVPPWSQHGGLPIAHRRHFSLKSTSFYTFSISSIRYRHQRPVPSGAGRWRPRRRQRTGRLPPPPLLAPRRLCGRRSRSPHFSRHEARPRGRRAIRPGRRCRRMPARAHTAPRSKWCAAKCHFKSRNRCTLRLLLAFRRMGGLRNRAAGPQVL